MLHSIKKLNDFTVVATDGEIGGIEDVYFDDEKWALRYLVIDAGGVLGGRRVLISPISIQSLDWDDNQIHVDLSMEQVEKSPGIDTAKPVLRQHEVEFYDHYGYPYYWTGALVWGATVYPSVPDTSAENAGNLPATASSESQAAMENANAVAHLRSTREMKGNVIHATDDELGHVEDFLFNDEDWSIQLIVIDPRNWWPGKHVLVSPQRIKHVNWDEQKVEVDLSRAQIETSPEYNPDNMDTSQVQQVLQFEHQQQPPA